MIESNKSGRVSLLELFGLLMLVVLAAAMTAGSMVITSPRSFGLVRVEHLTGIKRVSGFMYEAPLPAGFLPRKWVFLRQDWVVFTESGKPFLRHPTFESDIRDHGHGGYRFEGARLRFSSLDGSPPDTNGRDYAVSAPAIHAMEGVVLLSWAACLAVWVVAVVRIFGSRALRQTVINAWAACACVLDRMRKGRRALAAFYSKEEKKPAMLGRICSEVLPVPFFAGVAAGLGLCIIAGHQAARIDVYGDRSRFFLKIAPEGYVYPTVENIRRFVEGKAPPGKILVLVGGSSIPLGVGQTNEALWTKQLQKTLGDAFAVVNVSFRGAYFTSIALPLAEILSKEYPRLYLVTDTVPCEGVIWARNDNIYPYDYFLWQSWVEGRLMPDPGRDMELRRILGPFKPGTERNPTIRKAQERDAEAVRLRAQENILHAVFEEFTWSGNLWNAIGYRYFFTVYSFMTYPGRPFWLPRKMIRDDESEDSERPPVPQRFEKSLSDEVSILHKMCVFDVKTGADGKPYLDVLASNAIESLNREMPQAFPKDHILFLVTAKSAYTVEHLSPDDKSRYMLANLGWAKMLNAAGFNSIPLGLDYSPEDYVDGSHFSVKAAPKMARDVARALQDMAKKDGWLDERQ